MQIKMFKEAKWGINKVLKRQKTGGQAGLLFLPPSIEDSTYITNKHRSGAYRFTNSSWGLAKNVIAEHSF